MLERVIATVAALAVAGTACATSSGPADGGLGGSTPTLIMRVDVTGGFVPPTFNAVSLPPFSLFSDGTLVVPGAQIEIYPQPALPAINQRTITDPGVAKLLEAAREAGLKGEDRGYLDQSVGGTAVADAGTTVFTVIDGDATHTTKVYGLDELPAAGARAALKKFRDDLSDLERWLPAGSVGEEKPFTSDRLRLVVQPYTDPEEPDLRQPEKAWPLEDALGSFGTQTDLGYRCGAVDGDDAATVLRAANEANQLTPWTSEAARFSVAFRPLMADEKDC